MWRNFYYGISDLAERKDTIAEEVLPKCFAHVRSLWYRNRECGHPDSKIDQEFEAAIDEERRDYIISKNHLLMEYSGQSLWDGDHSYRRTKDGDSHLDKADASFPVSRKPAFFSIPQESFHFIIFLVPVIILIQISKSRSSP